MPAVCAGASAHASSTMSPSINRCSLLRRGTVAPCPALPSEAHPRTGRVTPTRPSRDAPDATYQPRRQHYCASVGGIRAAATPPCPIPVTSFRLPMPARPTPPVPPRSFRQNRSAAVLCRLPARLVTALLATAVLHAPTLPAQHGFTESTGTPDTHLRSARAHPAHDPRLRQR